MIPGTPRRGIASQELKSGRASERGRATSPGTRRKNRTTRRGKTGRVDCSIPIAIAIHFALCYFGLYRHLYGGPFPLHSDSTK